MKSIILFGAGSAIAKSYIEHVQSLNDNYDIICISSTTEKNNLCNRHYQTDYSIDNLSKIVFELKKSITALHQVVIFNGQLHNAKSMPEKKIENINNEYFCELMQSNTLTPIVCLQSILPLLDHSTKCTITALSARVGSITDNQLGGWYTYRASKAALNMLFQTAAIELARRAKQTKLLLFHPGTTDTPLSKPFQRNVPKDKLFTTSYVAQQLFALTQFEHLECDGQVDYIDWKGNKIPW
jgi:NAD(P)-dependent dehydrogenase (short-subunit alcohol dehydrogenase family)